MSNDTRRKGESLADVASTVREEVITRDWKRSRTASILGASSIVRGFDSAKESGFESAGRVSSLLKAAFKQDESGRAVSDEIVGPRERFVASMQRNGKNSSDIARSVQVTYHQFWLYAALLAATVVFGVVTFPSLGSMRGWYDYLFAVLFRISPFPLLLALMLRAGWTNWAFRRFRLDGVMDYLNAGSAMLPRKEIQRRGGVPATSPQRSSAPVRRQIAVILGLGLGAALALHMGVGSALADNLDQGRANANQVFIDPNPKDMFIRLLSYVIPNAGPIPANEMAGDAGPYQLIRDGLTVFAATLLFVGMLMSGWQIINGIVASAKEGTAIGRNYHEVWAPVRTVIGYGMLVPVANGLCGAQLLCLYLIAWGGNLANLIWAPYVDGAAYESKSANAQTLARQSIATNGAAVSNGIIQQIFEKELCRASINTGIIRQAWIFPTAAAPTTSPSFAQPIGNSLNWFNRDNIYVANYGPICGNLEITVRAAAKGSAVTDPAKRDSDKIPGSPPDSSLEDNTASIIGTARKVQIQKMKDEIAALADTAAKTYQSTTGSEAKYFSSDNPNLKTLNDKIAQMRRDYVDSITQVVISNISGSQSTQGAQVLADMKRQAKIDGWAASGTYYLTLARVQGNLYSAAFAGLKSDPITQQTTQGVSTDLARVLFGDDRSNGVIPSFRAYWSSNINYIAPDQSANLTKAGSNSVLDIISDFSLWTAGLFMHLDVNPLNPMQAMIDYGDFLMRTGMGIFMGIIALKTVGSIGSSIGDVVEKVPGVGSLVKGAFSAGLDVFITPLSLAAGIIIVAGIVHAYVIPFIPYILVLFFVGGMLFLTVESLVAAPLWAFFHIRLDGQEFIDQVQKPGYMIAFNLLLRPVLMIFGLILSMLTFGAMSWFVNQTFMPAANGLAASTTIGPFGLCALVVMVAYINLTLASKSFHLITEIPDRVTRWFGQGGERLNEDGDTKAITAGVIGVATQHGTGMITNTMLGQTGKGPPLSRRPGPRPGTLPPGGGGGGDQPEGGGGPGGAPNNQGGGAGKAGATAVAGMLPGPLGKVAKQMPAQ